MKTNINKISDADLVELEKIGKELEEWRLYDYLKKDVSEIFSNSKWKLGKITVPPYMPSGMNVISDFFVVFEPDKNLFYHNTLIHGSKISDKGKIQINYEILTQESYDEVTSTEMMIEFAKIHVELALKEAIKCLPYDDRLNRDIMVSQAIDKCYPLENIK
jgi:hypothetical protein